MKIKQKIGMWTLIVVFSALTAVWAHGTNHGVSPKPRPASECAEDHEKCIKKCDDNDSKCFNKCAEDEAHCRGMY